MRDGMHRDWELGGSWRNVMKGRRIKRKTPMGFHQCRFFFVVATAWYYLSFLPALSITLHPNHPSAHACTPRLFNQSPQPPPPYAETNFQR